MGKPARLPISVRQKDDPAAYMREYRKLRGNEVYRQQCAYSRALRELARLYPGDFERLYCTERALLGLHVLPDHRHLTKNLVWLDGES